MQIGKVQNANINFGKLVIEKANKTKIPLTVLCCDKAVKNAFADSFEKIDKASGQHRVSLYVREYRDDTSVHLTSVHWQKILPSLRIAPGISTEDKVKAIEEFTKKATQRMSFESVPDISDLINKYQ